MNHAQSNYDLFYRSKHVASETAEEVGRHSRVYKLLAQTKDALHQGVPSDNEFIKVIILA